MAVWGVSMSDDDSHDDIELKFNKAKIKNFFKGKAFEKVIFILLILIPIILTIYIRAQPQSLPATDGMAQTAVSNYFKNNIAQQVNSQYPNLPTAQRQKLIDDQYAQYYTSNQAMINQQVQQTSQYFKSGFQYQENNNTYTFLGDLDSYYWLRQARNIEEKGTVCDEIGPSGNCIDNHMLAPINYGAGPSLHPYMIVYVHKLFHIFDSKINLMQASFFVPTIGAIIAAIAAFFIGRRLMNNTAGFFAAIFIAVNPLLLSRTIGSDDDIWVIMFSLVVMWAFIEAFEAKSLLKKIILTVITGAVFGLFGFAWGGGWWYMFDFIIVGLLAYIGFELIKHYFKEKKISKATFHEVKFHLLILLILIVSSGIFVSMFIGFGSFISAFTSPISISNELKVAATQDLWGNILTTVAELNAANISTIINQVAFGVNFLFSIALLGIIFTLIKREPDLKEYILIGTSAILYLYLISNNAMAMNPILYLFILSIPLIIALLMLLREKDSVVDTKPAFLIMIWFVGMIYASTQGLRFILLITPVFSVAFGVAIGYIYQYFARVFHKDLKINEKLSKVIVFAILALLLISPIQAGIATGKSFMPSMTKGWWDSLTKLREESKPDAIITSWWDFGHWFKYVADRRVTFDGASQMPPLGHWAGKSLQTNNETETLGIVRMLDCGSNNAFDAINKKYNDTEKSENIVSAIILLSKDDAGKYLANIGYNDAEIKEILNYSHCTPPEAYYITSEDMVGKSGVWAHFGTWSIDKAFIVNNLKDKPLNEAVQVMKDRWNYTDDYATKIYYEVQALQTDQEMNDWIAPWPSYATGSMVPCFNISDMVLCDLGINIGGNSQQNYILQRAVINLTDPGSSQVLISVYDKTSNTKVGDSIAAFNEVFIAGKELQKYTINNATIGLSILINIQQTDNQTKYSALVADPLLIDSTFTKLFYLDGKYMTHFEKFSDTTDITGSRIIIWKIKW